jgi:hypothetical protein
MRFTFQRMIHGRLNPCELWDDAEGVYQVQVRRNAANGFKQEMTHLEVSRVDKQPIFSWHDMQLIKNEIVGAECEAIEIFPAESRMVDFENNYHLWVFANPKVRIPCGFSPPKKTKRVLLGASFGQNIKKPQLAILPGRRSLPRTTMTTQGIVKRKT